MTAVSALAACRLIQLPEFHDSRGSLTFIEGGNHIPFAIRRIYYLYHVPNRRVRGSHAHKALHQIFIAVAGSFDLTLDDGCGGKVHHHLSRPEKGLYVGPMVWREVANFSRGAVCLVLASEPYDEDDYYRNYDDFVSAVATQTTPAPGNRP
jgi:dTDP-4-dehydrorhamnose 3,5-epimerase-like enzyme